MKQLNLNFLGDKEIPGISSNFGKFLAEAAMVCLHLNQHESGVVLKSSGTLNEDFEIVWSEELTEDVIDSWKDLNEATEYGATAIAMLLTNEVLKMKRVVRNIGAADYIISDVEMKTDQSNYPMVYLEISGIFSATTNNTLTKRVNQKVLQVKKGVASAPFLVVVVEFSSPEAKIKSHL
ncbi:MAG: hypothetical protein AAF849_20835 [Bacteroidota bacterium]